MDKYFKKNGTTFVWDSQKDESNQKKHKISFETAIKAFNDPAAHIEYDSDHSDNEDRFHLLGKIHGAIIILVVFTENKAIRIISARKASKMEKLTYAKR